MSGLELVTCKQTDTSDLWGPNIITGLSNQMIWWLLKSFCLVLTASIFSRHVIQEAATIFLLGFHFSICVLFHLQLRAVIFRRCYGELVFRALPLLRSANQSWSVYFWKIQGCKDLYHLSSWTLRTYPTHLKNKLILWLGASALPYYLR